MKFLIDNQLPRELARWICARGHEAVHVQDAHLAGVSDADVWRFASRAGMAIVSKDEDFLHLVVPSPAPLPFVWVRLGNCRTGSLLAAFEAAWPDIVAAIAAGQRVLEVR